MPSFSVLTVSKRTGWFDEAKRCVAKQTEKPEEWIIVSEPESNYEVHTAYYDDWQITTTDAPEKTKVSNLNASLNKGLRMIDSDYVIFFQDFINLPEDCFEKLLNLADANTFVTTCTPNYDGTDDGRYLGHDAPRPCKPSEWETNVALAPMAFLRKLGGFDEDYDNGWSWDNVNVAERAKLLGARFVLDESNRPKLYPHEMKSREGLELNGDRHALNMRAIKAGKKPIKLPYLD